MYDQLRKEKTRRGEDTRSKTNLESHILYLSHVVGLKRMLKFKKGKIPICCDSMRYH